MEVRRVPPLHPWAATEFLCMRLHREEIVVMVQWNGHDTTLSLWWMATISPGATLGQRPCSWRRRPGTAAGNPKCRYRPRRSNRRCRRGRAGARVWTSGGKADPRTQEPPPNVGGRALRGPSRICKRQMEYNGVQWSTMEYNHEPNMHPMHPEPRGQPRPSAGNQNIDPILRDMPAPKPSAGHHRRQPRGRGV